MQHATLWKPLEGRGLCCSPAESLIARGSRATLKSIGPTVDDDSPGSPCGDFWFDRKMRIAPYARYSISSARAQDNRANYPLLRNTRSTHQHLNPDGPPNLARVQGIGASGMGEEPLWRTWRTLVYKDTGSRRPNWNPGLLEILRLGDFREILRSPNHQLA